MFPFRKKVSTKVDKHILVGSFVKELDKLIDDARSRHIEIRVIADALESRAKGIRQRAAVV